MIVEFAKASDAGAILQILAEGFPAPLLSYTPLGCPGSCEYVADLITLRNRGCDSRWIVARDEGVAGFVEVRLYGDELFVNHIYVRSDRQRRGLGSYLLKRSLELTRPEGVTRVSLDVFLENEGARRWYSRINFSPIEERLWATMKLQPSTSHKWFCVAGFPQADCVHARYGFSQFVLRTVQGNYEIGRLGNEVFRTTDPQVLEDSAALWGLGQLGPSRRLLVISHNDFIAPNLHTGLTRMASAMRMAADLDEVIAQLNYR